MSDLPQRVPGPAGEPTGRTSDWRLLETVLAGLTADEGRLEACGGELLVHADGRVECLDDPRCSTDPALHLGVVRCAAVVDGGCCAARDSA